ncbi:MAG TPA: NADH-quinone oxidoreductase subunit N [Solirubrobacterales bacterium]|jgi:NADH-quinone oxidoreductase subunit N|nr:NADH-quinone oxidoreductase subunit N [Solirubrobacterales bacterium]
MAGEGFVAPHVDYAGLAPVIALTVGLVVILMSGVFGPTKRWAPGLAVITLAATAGLLLWHWNDSLSLVAGALRVDDLAISISLIAIASAFTTILLSIRERAADEAGHGEYYALLIGSVLGMVLLSEAENLVTFFVALETLSIPLYILCATNLRREGSLESGLKYLIVGSLGSATLLYGMAFIYGSTGSTGFAGIAQGIEAHGMLHDPLLLIGIALAAVGLAFKTSIAPFHQWTPDVYQGAPTPITSFMAVATKAAAFAVFLRFFVVALGPETGDWQMGLAILAAISIVVGNVGALGQSSLKRLLGYSGVAQAGYMLGGLVVATEKGVSSLVFYLAAYLFMNLAAFAVVVARERETPYGDDIRGVRGLGAERPALAWPLTISMLALAGLPATAGFIGKLYLIEALVEGSYTWLGVFIAVGTMISLAYYLRVVAAMWMSPGETTASSLAATGVGGPAGTPGPVIAGASPEADPVDPRAGSRWYLVAPAVLAAAITVFFGVIPQPLVDFASHAGASLF